MKILHVVSLVDPEGSFGGPLRVAVNQLTALKERGHEVTLAAGARGFGRSVPEVFDGVRLVAFPAFNLVPGTGFAGLASPQLLVWLARHAHEYDMVHVHLARDLISLPAAALLRARRVPYVVQTHGMVDGSARRSAQLLDAVMTRRVLRSAGVVFALTSREVRDLHAVADELEQITVLHNGVPRTELRADPARSREVLFLARIAERKCPHEFVLAAQEVAARVPDATFALVGPEEDALGGVQELLAQNDAGGRIVYEGALEPAETLRRMTRSAVYVLPAVDEPFGMTVFEAMSVGLPTIVRSDCGLSGVVEETGGVVVSDGNFASAMMRLLEDSERRARAGESGRRYVREHADMDSVCRVLAAAYAGNRGGGE